MSISVDTRKLEQVAAFSTFVEVLSKPEELAKALKGLDEKIVELKELVGARVTIVDAEKWADEYEAETKAKREALEAQKEEFEAIVAKARKADAESKAKLKDFEDKLNERAKQLDDIKAAQEAIAAEMEAKGRELHEKEDALNTAAADLAEREAVLKEKAEKLAALLG